MKKIKDTQYLYLTSNIRAMENRMIGQQALHKMIGAKTPEEAYKTLTDVGIGTDYDYRDFEKALNQELAATYERLENAAPDAGVFRIFKYKYDGHNLKTLIKSQAVGSKAEDLMLPHGNVPVKVLINEFKEGSYNKLAPRLAEAAISATEVLAKSSDPQMVDVIIDKAVLEIMMQECKAFNNKFLSRIVTSYIDIANIRSFVRIKRIGKELNFLKEVIAEGGSIPSSKYSDLYLKSFDDFFEMLMSTSYGSALEPAFDNIKTKGGTLSLFEKLCDNYSISILKESRFIAFGIEPVLSYLLAKENETQSVRIVLTSKMAGVAPDKITERLRDSYA